MLWLYLLGIVTFLIIVLRRVLRKQKPLHDELYSKKVAIEYVYTGVAWVGEDSKLGSVNPALARALQIDQNSLIGRDWYEIFAVGDRNQVREAYKLMLLMGKASLEVRGLRADGSFEVRVAARSRAGNWLPTGGIERYTLVLRLYDTPVGVATRTQRDAPMPSIATAGCP